MKAPARSSASSSRASSIPERSSGDGRSLELFPLLAEHDHEQVSIAYEPTSGYRGIIAIHSTVLGPALGGTRFWSYRTDAAALMPAPGLATGRTHQPAAEGARLVLADIDPERARRVVDECRAQAVPPDDIYGVRADVFAPCALGAVINDATLPRLQVEIVAGGANNQLAEERHGDLLEARGITYAPDYVINGGGLINVNAELAGWSLERARAKAAEIYDTILRVFEIAREEGIPAYRAADRLAEQRIAAVSSVRRNLV